ncbi:hypothetical protein CC1G_07865 [Coprinopsis cinerea okayama7|uniref:DUF202 domain-containing protein n=1 Tax=Coprinopsis cinerea (strain Okayama-7 / 130 / ATCC MYA-4618 / FGSC 9003) TaxID=240176 RepID=A8P441_COPC7|nr:hypothetical protein CC1G_07865 [Coprinopsis cinerea okayama7\|eukprot:XP_001838674.1 hypothetical protein CC1G_07865 [Coprinopsis cinerea okayama7\
MASSSIGNDASDVETSPSPQGLRSRSRSLIRRSWQAALLPFSPSALASLPRLKRPARYLRADNIPTTDETEEGQRPAIRDYHAINSVPPQVRVPKKVPTSVKVEGKVWFANERTWISWLNQAMLLAALSVALFNASNDDIARNFALVYAGISVCTIIYGYAIYQHRITMIRRRDPGHFDALLGPVLLSVALFFAVLSNFIIRVRELQRKEVPFPGSDLLAFLAPARNISITQQSFAGQAPF